MTQQRDVIKTLSPPWLSSGVAERYMYNFGLSADVLLEKLNQAMRAHMPGVGTSTALVYIGNDRVIPQGPYESDVQYAARLQTAFEAWQRAGSRRAVLSQVLSYLDSPALSGISLSTGVFDSTFDSTFVAGSGLRPPIGAIVGGTRPDWDVYYAGDARAAPPTHVTPSVHQFDWDGDFSKWWRAWLVLYFTPIDLGRSGAAASITSTAGFGDVTGLTGMVAGDVGRILILSGAANGDHDGAFRIEAVVSSTRVSVSCGVSDGSDGNDGAIAWVVKEYATIKPGPAWDAPGAVWDDPTRSWGLANPPAVMASVREILRQWQSEHSFYVETVIVFSGGTGASQYDFSPYSTPGLGNPDGTWAHYSKIDPGTGASIPARIFTGTDSGIFAKFNEFAQGSDNA